MPVSARSDLPRALSKGGEPQLCTVRKEIYHYNITGSSLGCVSRPSALLRVGKDRIVSWKEIAVLAEVKIYIYIYIYTSVGSVTYKVYFRCSSISMIAAWLPQR